MLRHAFTCAQQPEILSGFGKTESLSIGGIQHMYEINDYACATMVTILMVLGKYTWDL